MAQPTPSRLDRRLLLAAAGGAVLMAILLRTLFAAGGGGDVSVGMARPPVTAPAHTTTVTSPTTGEEPAPPVVEARDPFGQLVTVADAGQAQQSAPSAQAAAVPAPRATPAQVAAAQAPTMPSTTTTRPAAPAPPAPEPPRPPVVQAAQPPPQVTAALLAPTTNTVLGTAGPFAVPGVPLDVCFDGATPGCTTTAPATSVSVAAVATIDPAAPVPPTVVPTTCSNGQGGALLVTAGSTGSVVYGSVTVIINGSPTVFSVELPVPAPQQTVLISACAHPGVAVRVAPAGTPAPPPAPSGSLVGGLLQSLLGVLGNALTGGGSLRAPSLLGLAPA
ncbi:MAG: hypothetical protein ACRD1D_07400 [Acidimicrobiales bacterium]